MIIETKGYSCRKCQSEDLVKKRPPSNCKKIPVLEGEELWSFVFRSKDKVIDANLFCFIFKI